MASPEPCVQEVISCELCEKLTQKFCNSCQVSLCEKCVSKHIDMLQSVTHDIVPFLDKTEAFPQCQEHIDEICKAHCHQCQIPICMTCLLELHQGHTAMKLTHAKRIEEIQYETSEILHKIIPKYQKEDSGIEEIISEKREQFDNDGKDVEKHRQLWHQEVDNIFDKISSVRQEHETKNLELLEEHRKNIESLISEMSNRISKSKAIVASRELSQINGYTNKLLNYEKVPEIISSTPPVLEYTIYNENGLNIGIEKFGAKITHSFTIPRILMSKPTKPISPSPKRPVSGQTRFHYNTRQREEILQENLYKPRSRTLLGFLQKVDMAGEALKKFSS